MFVIYRYFHIESGKSYIGQTYNMRKRKNKHRHAEGGCPLFHRAVRKYGKDAFDYEILIDNLSEEEVDDAEKDMIAFWETKAPHGYNLDDGGNSNKTTHPETSAKISEKLRGENHPLYGIRGKDSHNYGREHTAESKSNMSAAQRKRYSDPKERDKHRGEKNAFYGKKHDYETRLVMARKARKRNNPLQLTLFD